VLGIDLCGEEGEYHTFVFNGPIFSRPVEYALGQIRSVEGYSVVELLP
jgi:diphthamide synthase (EF-2-diphthine--ammonia ligase)